jgi:ferredoxin-fold anticodon binding domain-containing protein
MKILTRIISDVFFTFALLINHLLKAIIYLVSLLNLKLQKIFFGVSKANLKRKQQAEFRRVSDRNTRIHLKELADLLEAELNKYQQKLESQKFYKLKTIIAKSLDRGDLDTLTSLHKILFDLPNEDVLRGLSSFGK